MEVLALKRVKEFSETSIVNVETAFVVLPGETVEELLERTGIVGGGTDWHYSHAEIVLKLIKPPIILGE